MVGCLSKERGLIDPGQESSSTFLANEIRYRSFVPFSVRPMEDLEITLNPGALTVIDKSGQATKGVWWMPWHREATKDVVACDMLREAGKQASIRRFLNAETRFRSIGIIQR